MNDKKFIYVLSDELGRIKFGITNNVAKRISQISNATGLNIKNVYVSVSSHARYLEQKLLEYFNNYRLNGTEWIVTGLSFYQIVSVVQSFLDVKGK